MGLRHQESLTWLCPCQPHTFTQDLTCSLHSHSGLPQLPHHWVKRGEFPRFSMFKICISLLSTLMHMFVFRCATTHSGGQSQHSSATIRVLGIELRSSDLYSSPVSCQLVTSHFKKPFYFPLLFSVRY